MAQHFDYRTIKHLALVRNHTQVEKSLKAVQASSQDFNQSIYATLLRKQSSFWSSGPSESPDASEFLLYSLPGVKVINSVIIQTYNASQIQSEDDLYPTRKIKILVGNSED